MIKKPRFDMTAWKQAALDTLPVFAAYLILGMGFGVMMSREGFSIWLTILMSIVCFAGSLQYVAVPLLAAGASHATFFFMTLLVNARHIFYGLSVLERYEGSGLKKPYLIFGLTDETYSLVCRQPYVKGEQRTGYYFAVTLLNHLYWIAGSALGGILGNTLRFNSRGIEFSLTALFVVIFVDQWQNTKRHLPALIGLGMTLISRVLFGRPHFLVIAMVLILIALLLLESIRPEYRLDVNILANVEADQEDDRV
jgi:4-azaleucine resistance transporter AzlC